MKAKADMQWDRLARAAVDARDDYRRIHQLAERVKDNPYEVFDVLKQVQQLAAGNADRLRLALKDPEGFKTCAG